MPVEITTAMLVSENIIEIRKTDLQQFYFNAYSQKLKTNELNTLSKTIKLQNVKNSAPYWLNENQTVGMYNVDNQELRGLAK